MADDGMLVNFSLDDAFTRKAPKFKGGSWKDRLIAKNIAKNRGQRRENGSANQTQIWHQRQLKNSRPTAAQEDVDFPTERPAKRRRENGDSRATSTHNPKHTQNSTPRSEARSHLQSKNREVVSSLFTYNPTSTAAVEPPSEPADEVPSKPSNAPLPDGIDTFTSLGLSATLAAHLLTKMELKNPTAIQKASVAQLLKEDSDAFVQSETGSGKTLAYLLPLVQRIMAFSEELADKSGLNGNDSNVHRDSGLFAIVLAPTRELCKQISVVLERLLGCAHYIVAGTVIGGEKKKSEKARLRKGLNILVATPGRLVDHLANTRVLDVSNVRWLVLDEGDRLMDLGFEEDVSKIVATLDQRQKKNSRSGLPDRRTTVLCSATMKMNVQRLGEISLKDAVLIKGAADDEDDGVNGDRKSDSNFLAPAQLKQSYIVVAAKLRLVTLTALLRRTFARKGSVMKAIVFVSCADSVEFHFKVLTRTDESTGKTDVPDSSFPEIDNKPPLQTIESLHDAVDTSRLLSSSQNPLTIYKLHGSLPQITRTAIVKAFSTTTTPSLLVATDVASRGLDLPNLDLVIEYDPPFSSDDHLHRIGRTARLGRDGRAVIFLLPGAEEGYVDILKSSYKSTAEGTRAVTQSIANDVLKKGFSPMTGLASAGKDWEQKATDFQLDVERWVLASAANGEMAKRAFQSQVRAYATHVAAERKWFDIKELHLGHLAKAFGLRDAPGRLNMQGMGKRGASKRRVSGDTNVDDGKDEPYVRPGEVDESALKMRKKVGNLKMLRAGADEFNIV